MTTHTIGSLFAGYCFPPVPVERALPTAEQKAARRSLDTPEVLP